MPEAYVEMSNAPIDNAEFKRPKREPDLKVTLTLFTPDQGGRVKPLWQGCRFPHDFGLPGEFNDGMYEFAGSPPAPGSSAEAIVWLLAPERNKGRLYEGFNFQIWEGRFVGRGKVLEVRNAELRQT